MSQIEQTESSTPVQSRCHAIVIGIDKYDLLKPGVQLKGCVNDARSIRDFFVNKVHIPTNQLTFLTSPASDPKQLATAKNIRAAFDKIAKNNAIQKDDHVILFYASHGVRLKRKDDTASVYYGIVASDSNGKDGNLVLDGEINGLLRALQKRSVSTTVIADTCHSGASTRDIGESESAARCIEVPPMSDNDWANFHANHPALGPHASRDWGDADSRARVGKNLNSDADFVVLAACQDKEKSYEVGEKDEHGRSIIRGALTSTLLQKLSAMPAEQVKSLRWTDFFEDLRDAVREVKPQTPTLEGKPERRVFGGQWRPFAPGFTVIEKNGVYVVEGGIVKGLEVGAKLELYPWETYDYKDSAAAPVHAEIIEATPSTSTLKLVDANRFIASKMRARLAKIKPMQVRFRNVPPEILNAARLEGKEFKNFVAVVGSQNAKAHVEVRPFKGEIPVAVWEASESSENTKYFQGARDGWVFVRSDNNGEPGSLPPGFKPAAEDILAYLPGAGPPIDGFSQTNKRTKIGNALHEGLIHYANYLHIRDRKGGDETLGKMLSVKLRVGKHSDWPSLQTQSDNARVNARIEKMSRIEPQAGVYSIQDDQCSFLEVKVLESTRLRLFVGVLLFSDDGNVIAVWPPEGQRYTFEGGSTTHIGDDRFNPLKLRRRQDQRSSFYTLKLITYTADKDSPAINLQDVEQKEGVQDIFARRIRSAQGEGTRGGIEPPKPPPPGYCIWDFRIARTR